MTEPIRVVDTEADYDERAPYTLVLGNGTEDSRVEYKGEMLPGMVAAAVTVGDIGDCLDVADGERTYLLVKIRMQYVCLKRDPATLHGGEIEIEAPNVIRRDTEAPSAYRALDVAVGDSGGRGGDAYSMSAL